LITATANGTQDQRIPLSCFRSWRILAGFFID